MLRFLERRAPQSHHRVADIFVERAFVAEDDARHFREVTIQQVGKFLGIERFGNCRESADVTEKHRDGRFPRLYALGISKESPNNFRADVLLKRTAHLAFFLLLDKHAVHRHQHHVGNKSESCRHDEVQQPAVQESQYTIPANGTRSTRPSTIHFGCTVASQIPSGNPNNRMNPTSASACLPPNSRKCLFRMLSITFAWISTPGKSRLPKGVERKSPIPVADAPTRTILSLKVPGENFFRTTSANDTYGYVRTGPLKFTRRRPTSSGC